MMGTSNLLPFLLLLLSEATTSTGCCFEVEFNAQGEPANLVTTQVSQEACMKTNFEPEYKGWRTACAADFDAAAAVTFINENTFSLNVVAWNLKDFPIAEDLPEKYRRRVGPFLSLLPYSGQKERLAKVPEALLLYPNVDVLLLQEAYRNTSMKTLEEGLSSTLGGDWTVRLDAPAADKSALGSDLPPQLKQVCSKDAGLNGGVRIATKHTVVEEKHHVFETIPIGNLTDIGMAIFDGISAKGVAYAKIRKTNQGGSKCVYFHVFSTHLQSGGGSWANGSRSMRQVRKNQMREVHAFIQAQNIPAGEPVILGGDFNIDIVRNPKELDAVVSILEIDHPKHHMFIDGSTGNTVSSEVLENGSTQLSTFDVCKNTYFTSQRDSWSGGGGSSWGGGGDRSREETLPTTANVSEIPYFFFYDADRNMRKQGAEEACRHVWLDYIVWPKANLQPKFKYFVALTPRAPKNFTYYSVDRTKITLRDVSDHYPVASTNSYLFEDTSSTCSGPGLSKANLTTNTFYCVGDAISNAQRGENCGFIEDPVLGGEYEKRCLDGYVCSCNVEECGVDEKPICKEPNVTANESEECGRRSKDSDMTYLTKTCVAGLQCVEGEERDGDMVFRCLAEGSAGDGMRRSAIIVLLFHALWSIGW